MQRQLFATYDDLHDTLTHFSGLYGGYTHGRPKTVSEHVKAFQLHALAQDFLNVLDAFRLFTCLALCPRACTESSDSAVQADIFAQVQLVEALNNLKLDVELVADDPHFDFTAGSQRFLREAKQYAVTLLASAPQSGGGGIDWDEALTACVTKVVSRIMFPLMKVVSLSSKHNESDILLHGVSLDNENPASMSASYISPLTAQHFSGETGALQPAGAEPFAATGELSFEMLHSLATSSRSLQISTGPSSAFQGLCSPSLSPHLYVGSVVKWPRRWRLPSTDAGPMPRVMQMLEHIEGNALELSHSYLALRAFGNEGWAQNIKCSGTGIDYDPTLCLHSRGWGGYVYSVNVHPPYRAELRVLGRGLGDSSQAGESSFMDVLRPYPHQGEVQTVSLDQVFYRIDFLWRQSNEPSPDVFFLHPAVHNCYAVEYLFTGAPVKPKILVIPINPLVPPPFEVMPRFEAWWRLLRPAISSTRLARDWVKHAEQDADGDADASREEPEASAMDDYLHPSFWLGQCSLAAVNAMLRGMAKKKFKYTLHHVDQAFAVYVREDLDRALSASKAEAAPPDLFGHWLEGWFCAPDSRYFSRLEVVAGPEMLRLADHATSDKDKEAILCRFLAAHHVPVQRRGFDCNYQTGLAGSNAADGVPTGPQSCIRPDLRGWGNEAAVQDSVQDSAFACEAQCALSSCSYWTFDPTAMYGQTLCWIWKQGRPAEIKAERGWISGDADCYRESFAQGSDGGASGTAAVQDTANKSSPRRLAEATAAQSRELFKQWSIQQPVEIPGMRYFLESGGRGRCVRGFCECFPPYRGPLCKDIDPGAMDSTRNFTGVLHYLTSDDPDDIADIRHSLPRLWERFNRRFDYPVVIFNDGLSEDHRRQIVEASENRIWFAYVDDYLDVPDMITKDPTRNAMLGEVKWSLGYRGMCRFRSGTIFLQPVLRNFEYAMTLDTDGYFPADVASDPISAMHEGGYIYTFSHLLPDLPGAVKHFWDYSLMYMRMKDIHPRGTEILQQFVREDDAQWNYQLYMNDIEIVQLEWFRSDPYQDYFRYLDSVGGFWLHRWGDHAVRTIAVGMWLPKERVYEMDVPYGHQNYCRCSAAHPNLTCVREEDVGGKPPKWWICSEDT